MFWIIVRLLTYLFVEAYYAGNVIKYVLRWKHKNGVEDLKEAKVYIDKIIEMEDGDQIQVKIDGVTYLVHSSQAALISE